MDELERIKLNAYTKYKRYMVAHGRGLYLSFSDWTKHVNSLITD